MAGLRLAAVLLLALLFIPLPANAAVVSNVDITCAKDGVEQTFTTGWDSDDSYFEGKGDIAKYYCEGGHSPMGEGATFVSDTLQDESARFYTGEPTAPEPVVEPSPEPEPEPEPTVSQEVYDQLVKEYDDYKAWAEQAIADYKGTISGLNKKIDSVSEALASKDKTIEELRSALDAYKSQETESKDKIASLDKQLSEALQALAKSKSDLEIQAAKSVDLEKQLKASQERVAELEGKLSNLEKRVVELESSLSDKDKALQSALAEIDTLIQQLKDAKATISEQQTKIEQLRAVTSDEGAPQNLDLAQEVKDIGIAKLATAEKDSEEYEAGLALLAVAAEADDPDLPEAVAVIPIVGAVAGQVLEAMNDLGNIGADISPEVRERSEEVVIAGVIVGGQVASASAAQAVRRKM